MNTNGKLNAANARSARDESLEESAMMRWELADDSWTAKSLAISFPSPRPCRVGTGWWQMNVPPVVGRGQIFGTGPNLMSMVMVMVIFSALVSSPCDH